MRVSFMSTRGLVVGLAIMLSASGCGSKLKWRVVGPLDAQPPSIDSLRIEATPVDTAALEKGHPFRWRGSKKVGFMLFDVKITNAGPKDLPCQVGHQDFPGPVVPTMTGSLLGAAMSALPTSGDPHVVVADDFQFTALSHEKATILLADGHRYQILGRTDFAQRYVYLMGKELGHAVWWHFIPRWGHHIASAQAKKATKRLPERLMQAQQMVMRPGVVPAGSTVRGYLVFGWPPDPQPGTFTLRLPVQPGHAASIQFELVRRD